jgi:hypothetical protein
MPLRAIYKRALAGAGSGQSEPRGFRCRPFAASATASHPLRSWDAKEGEIKPKSAAGRRNVTIASVLRGYLVEHRIRAEDPEGRVFGNASQPFSPTRVRDRASKAWKKGKLAPITMRLGTLSPR